MTRYRSGALALGLWAAFAASCAAPPQLESPKDPAVDQDEQYLVKNGPRHNLDLQAQGTPLLETLKQMEEERINQRRQQDRLQKQIQDLNQKLARAGEELEKEKTLRVGVEAERDDARKKLQEHDARLLAVAIERARLEQELLTLKIAALEKKAAGARTAETAPVDSWAAPAPAPGR